MHANALAQNYFVTTEEWAALRGKFVVLDKVTHSLQSVVAKQVMKTIQEIEIVNAGEVPKLARRSAMTTTVFQGLCESALNAMKYLSILRGKYRAVWDEVGSVEKLFERLIISGEPGLKEVFLRGVAVAAGKIDHLDFKGTDPTSELAQVCTRLQTADVLRQQVLRQQEELRATARRATAAAADLAIPSPRPFSSFPVLFSCPETHPVRNGKPHASLKLRADQVRSPACTCD